MGSKRHPSREEKGKLKNEEVPNVTLKAMKKALDNKDTTRHDEMYKLLLDARDKEK